MLKKNKDFLKRRNVRYRINLDKFNDPLAHKVEWSPYVGGGPNFRTHKLVQAGGARVEFKPTVSAMMFCYFFMFPGLGLIILPPIL